FGRGGRAGGFLLRDQLSADVADPLRPPLARTIRLRPRAERLALARDPARHRPAPRLPPPVPPPALPAELPLSAEAPGRDAALRRPLAREESSEAAAPRPRGGARRGAESAA